MLMLMLMLTLMLTPTYCFFSHFPSLISSVFFVFLHIFSLVFFRVLHSHSQSCAVKVNPFFNTLKASAQSVVVDLIFNLGCGGYGTFTGFAGFLRNKGLNIYGPGELAVGHSGWGGSCAFADPETRISAAYVMNKQSPYLLGDPRPLRLIEALYAAL